MEMLAAQAAHQVGSFGDSDTIATDEKLSDSEKKVMLQKVLNMAASNGDVDQVRNIVTGKAKSLVDVNAPDEDGTPPLIYASCFVRSLGIALSRSMLTWRFRVTKAWSKHSSMLAQMSTNKIATSGAL
jgi:hypothetical protein